MPEPKRVVIVGGGVAGIEIATRLGRTLGYPGKAVVTLVDRGLSHVWKPMLHTFAAGTSRPDREKVSFLAQARANGFQFCPGELTGVHRALKHITVAPFGQRGEVAVDLSYDALIVAVGSRANDFGTPGVAEHCMTIDDLKEAEAFHDRLRHHVFTALHTGREIDIAIVGGGATGVELAAELKRATDLLSGYATPALRQKLRLTLIESGSRLLAAFPDHVAQAATGELRRLGVDVRIGTMVTGADADGFNLKESGRIDAGLKVWAAGVKAPDVLARVDGLERSKTGQLMVHPTLQTTNDPAIFALGDCASLLQEQHTVPATAQAARQEALHLGRHFATWLMGGSMVPFRYHDRGALVSLADYNGWGTLGKYTFGGGRLRGLSARLAHDLLYRQHQFELFGVVRGTAAWAADGLESMLSPPVRLD